MAFGVPSSSGRSISEIVDTYPGRADHSVGGRSAGSQGRQTEGRISKVISDPRVQRIGGALANAALDKIDKSLSKRLRNNNKNNNNKGGRSGRGKSSNKDSNSYPPRDGNEEDNYKTNQSSGGSALNYGGSSDRRGQSCLLYSSGISAGLVVNSRLYSDQTSSLYLSSGWLFSVSDLDLKAKNFETPFIDQLRRILFPIYELVISNRINRYSGLYIDWYDFYEYMLSITKGLQMYYCLDNILAYSSNNSQDNVNYGMEALRNRLNADVISEFVLLRECLENQIVPPELLKFIRWICQSYRLSDAPHSSIIKLNIGGVFDPYWMDKTTHIETVLFELRDNIYKTNKMSSFMSRAFPGWLIGKLLPSADVACYDVNFITFWHNMNTCYKIGNMSKHYNYCNSVVSLDSFLDYEIIQRDTDVDGAIFSCHSIFIKEVNTDPLADLETKATYWGIWQPLADDSEKNIPSGNIRETYSLKFVNSIGAVEAITNPVMLGNSGVHWVCQYGGTVGNYVGSSIEFGTSGFVKVQVNTARLQNEAFNETIRKWFDPETAAYVDKRSGY